MKPNTPTGDPERAYVRRKQAARRAGRRRCACGEHRPRALISDSEPTLCAACQRRQQGRSPNDHHHVAGISNGPVTIVANVNDHRADLTEEQERWPTRTRENPDGSPALAAAGHIRGFVDTLRHLIKTWISCYRFIQRRMMTMKGLTHSREVSRENWIRSVRAGCWQTRSSAPVRRQARHSWLVP